MAYINANGSLTDERNRKRGPLGFVKSIIFGIIDVVQIFLGSITGNPAQIRTTESGSGSSNRSQTMNRRSGGGGGGSRLGRGSNIRGLKSLGKTTTAPAAGGG